jgi:hypothetical protein
MSGVLLSTHGSYISSASASTNATLVYDFDAANYTAVPTNGSTVSGYSLTVTNAGSISYDSANGGHFAKSNNVGTDVITGGPNYSAVGQSYSVFVAYSLNTTSGGRFLNTASEATNDWLMCSYRSGSYYKNVFYPNSTINLTSDTYTGDTGWNFIWTTYNGSTGVANLYIATSTQPAAVYKTATYATSSRRGFNQLRLFSRAGGSEVQTGKVGFIKVYDGALNLASVQSLHAANKSRFGY